MRGSAKNIQSELNAATAVAQKELGEKINATFIKGMKTATEMLKAVPGIK